MTFAGPIPKPAPRAKKQPKPIARGARPARVRKTKRGTERESLDRLWSQVVKSSHPLCVFRICCGGALAVDPAHIFGKGAYPRLRWLFLNGVGACRACHNTYDREWSAEERKAWAVRYLGQYTVDALMDVHLKGPSFQRETLRTALTDHLRRIAA